MGTVFDNIILATDSYKVSHYRQYPPETEYVYSYFESRGGKFKDICFFGLQYFVKRYLAGVVVTQDKIDEAEIMVNAHMGPGHFNKAGWEYILKECGGRLPIEIKAIPEGTPVPAKCALMTVVNTDPKCYWLTNYLETLLVQVWYPMTVATNSREHKKIIASYFDKTGCSRDPDASAFNFKLHDFGYRGVSSVESAALGGAAHLCNFNGTDTMAGIQLIKAYYNELDGNFVMPGFSIPAAEHSTITSWGRENETAALKNMLEQYPTGLVAVVSDSYNIYDTCENKWGKELKSLIENRDGTLVVRPDSGEPKIIVVEVLELLGKQFGTTKNDKGFKMLPACIRVIQGDGISYETLGEILDNMVKNDWAADNLVFGSGGALLQKLNRDTQKCAFKCSEVTKTGGETTLVYKDPITDKGKKSKMGRFTVERDASGTLVTITEGKGDPAKDVLIPVFRNGELLIDQPFSEIRKRATVTDAEVPVLP